MEIEKVKQFGLTNVEANIFMCLVRKGSLSLSEITRISGLHRGTVYNSLNKLIQKSFVISSSENKTTFYSPAQTNIFLRIIEKEKENIEEKETIARNIMQEIKSSQDPQSSKPKISVGLGKDAYYMHFVSMFETCKKKNIEYLWIGGGLGNTSKEMGEHNYHKIINLKKEMKIKFRSIMNIKAKSFKHKYYKPGDRYVEDSYSFPAYTWIYDNKTVIVDFKARPITVITIEDKEISDTYKTYFELLYKNAKK
jgi:sugar-specific transcriptional regulator TrmB